MSNLRPIIVSFRITLTLKSMCLETKPTQYVFVTAYTARFGIAPDGPAALGYDSTTIVIEAMRRTDDLTPTAIRDQIEATQEYIGAITLSRYDENRYAIKNLVINTVKDGKIQFHQSITP